MERSGQTADDDAHALTHSTPAGFKRPGSLDEALSVLSSGSWTILAGGTDVYPAAGDRPLSGNILDLDNIEELRAISERDEAIVIGAMTTWTDIIHADLPPAFDALKQAAREVGSVQIQNRATIAGNLCNASPAADGVPALLILDAMVELRSKSTRRLLPLADFILGNRVTALKAGELMTAIHVPRQRTGGASRFIKLGARRYLVISIAMAAVRLETGRDGRITQAAIALGACSQTAVRLSAFELALIGQAAGADLDALLDDTHLAAIAPIDDIRATAAYRRHAAREIIVRALRELANDERPLP